jgi:hypothetical protein
MPGNLPDDSGIIREQNKKNARLNYDTPSFEYENYIVRIIAQHFLHIYEPYSKDERNN